MITYQYNIYDLSEEYNSYPTVYIEVSAPNVIFLHTNFRFIKRKLPQHMLDTRITWVAFGFIA